jgi:hypothetical protein
MLDAIATLGATMLAVHAIGQFFAAPIIGDKPGLRLVVDNGR